MHNFVLQILSLQHLAKVKIVAELWSQGDITIKIVQSLDLPRDDSVREDAEEWREIEHEVKVNVSALPLPHMLRKQLFHLVKPIGVELLRWCRYNYSEDDCYVPLNSSLLNQLCWTMHGAVDYQKTAEVIVNDKGSDIETRYKVACVNCLEDKARELIQFIPEDRRQHYIDNMLLYCIDVPCILIGYFTSTLTGKVDQLKEHFETMLSSGLSFNKCLSLQMLRSGNRAACEYFFEKLTQREKEQYVGENATEMCNVGRDWPSCKLMYGLSLMNEEQQGHLFKKFDRVLVSLLSWPFQSLFIQVANRGSQFMCSHVFRCYRVLTNITCKISNDDQDYDYSQLFWECWRLSPDDCKNQLLVEEIFVDRLLVTRKEEFIELVLSEAPSRQIVGLCNRYNEVVGIFTDENAISDATLKECVEEAALKSSNDQNDEEKRLKSEYLTRFIDMVMESRIKIRIM